MNPTPFTMVIRWCIWTIIFTLLTSVATVSFCQNIFNQKSPHEYHCKFENNIFNRGVELYHQEQFLLSATHFSMLFNSECNALSLNLKSRYNYSLAVYRLGEIPEIIHQYAFLYHQMNQPNEFQLKNDIKGYASDLGLLLALATNDTSNVKIKRWHDLISPKKSDLKINPLYLKELAEVDPAASFASIWENYQQKINGKSPLLAATLSALVPGSGQLYNGTYQSAAVAFILNSIFLWSTINFIDQDQNGAALASGMVFSVTYLGNIVNAAQGSTAINEKNSLEEKKQMEKIFFPILNLKI